MTFADSGRKSYLKTEVLSDAYCTLILNKVNILVGRIKYNCKFTKVCILTSAHHALDARIFYREAVSLAEKGYEVHVFGNHPKDELLKNVYIHAVRCPNNGWFRKLSSSFNFLLRVFGEKADIYHFHDPDLIFCGLALQIFGKKVIMDVHEDFKLTIINKRRNLPKILRYIIATSFDVIEKLSSRVFSGVIVVSEEIERKFHFSNVALVRNFPIINKVPRRTRTRDNTFNVIYTGSIDHSRGCWQILEAFDLFKYRYPLTKLTMIGSFSESQLERDLKEKAIKIGSVDIRGYLPWEQVRSEQLEADVGLVISFYNKQSHEKAYPVKLFEYLSAGLPVIISRKHFWQQLLNESEFGIMVEGEDPEEIANALYKLATDRESRIRMSLAGRKVVEQNFSWSGEFIKMNSLYQKILGVSSKSPVH